MDKTHLVSGHHTWYLGVLLALFSSFIGALGDNLVRLSFIKESKRQNKILRPLYKRPLWILGELLTIIINPVMTIFALKFAAASIVVPFGGLHIFWNACLCGYLLKEKLSKNEIIGSVIILIGIILVVTFGTHQIPGYNLASLVNLLTEPYFMFYSVFSIFIIVILFVFGKVNIIQMAKDTFFVQVNRTTPTSHNSILAKLSISALSGICGGNGNLLAKACIESMDQEGFTVLWKFDFILLAASTLLLCLLQAISLTMALGRYEAKFVVPMVNACLVASGSAGGIILFKEYSDKNNVSMLFFSIGICSVIFGIFLLMIGASNFNIEEFLSKDEERSGLIFEDSFQTKAPNSVNSRAQFQPIDFNSSDSEIDDIV